MSKLSSLKPKVASVKPSRVTGGATKGIGGRPWSRIRARVLERDNGLCQACLADGRISNAEEVDHIVPRHRGGGDNEENLQSLCRDCHKVKSDLEDAERRR